MSKRLTNTEIVNLILADDIDNIKNDEEAIHILLDKKISKNINTSHKETLSLSDKVSDKLAKVAGSWAFIISFCAVLFVWITLNTLVLLKPFDPHPFILLNLVLSCIAAIQAPVILMSQNRQEEKDRIRSENDYKVNLKSELIVEDLHIKLDKLISNQEQIFLRLDSIDKAKS
jgi:uncharacterized membrane protein